MMNKAPERYIETEVLATYLETKNITIYCQGPIGIKPFVPFFENLGTTATTAFIKPNHWRTITEDYVEHQHVLILRHPMEAHLHASWLHGMSLHESGRKRDNMFYNTHLRPCLEEVAQAQFDFYIPFEELSHYLLHQYQTPNPPPMVPSVLFDIREEIEAYKYILENKIKMSIPQWRELLLNGQLREI